MNDFLSSCNRLKVGFFSEGLSVGTLQERVCARQLHPRPAALHWTRIPALVLGAAPGTA